MEQAARRRVGMVAVIGRPNVGKSTLVNALVGERVSITSRKPQTTRDRVLGVRTDADAQYIFVDTPGFQRRHRSALNQRMNAQVTAAKDPSAKGMARASACTKRPRISQLFPVQASSR